MKNISKILVIIFSLTIFTAGATEVSVIPALDQIQGGTEVVYDISVTDVNLFEGYTLILHYSTTDFMNVTASPGEFLSSNPEDLQFMADYSIPGQIEISCTLLNGQNGVSGNGILAHINLTSKMVNNTTGSPLTLSNVELRNIYNQPITTTTNDALVIIDCESPKFNNNNPLPLAENAWYNQAPVIPAANYVFSDNSNLHSVDHRVDNNLWQELATGISGAIYPDPPVDYILPNFVSLSEGNHMISWRADDDVAFQNSWSWQFNKDMYPPEGFLSMEYSAITTDGFTLVAGTMTDVSQGQVFYEFDEINDNAPDRERLEGVNTYTLTGLQHNTPYSFRFRASDGVTNNQPEALWDEQCNYSDWSVEITRYTKSVPPSITTVGCNKQKNTWYNTPDFTFTSIGGFGDGSNVAYYKYIWNREPTHTWIGNEEIWDASISADGTLSLNADIDADNWYLHLQGFNGENAPNGSYDFGPYYFDGTKPCIINGLTAHTKDNDNEAVVLNWVNPEDCISEIRIYAQPFGVEGVGTYPYYNGSEPQVGTIDQMSALHWTEIAVVDGTINQFIHSPALRNDWHYVLFTVDGPGNISDPSQTAHALSYWLGDVNTPPDGFVNTNDIGLLAASWGANGLEEPHIFRNVGPTIDNARDSRPQPDAYINFEDLMIYSLNYGNTNYLQKKNNMIMETTPIQITLEEQQRKDHQNTIEIYMDDIPNNMKGIEMTLLVRDPSQIKNINPGALIQDGDFFIHTRDGNNITITYSNLTGNMASQGAIATIDIDKCPDISLYSVVARDIRNAPLKTSTIIANNDLQDDLISVKNYPNPFSDKITFEVQTNTKGFITICIYNIHGQLVYQPINEHLPSGTHIVNWNGCDDFGNRLPNGTYFYTIRMNGHIVNNKIVLQR